MQCPVCKSYQNSGLALNAAGFQEELVECRSCGSSWSINHGLAELVNDSQKASFLEATTECVECDDYCFAA